MKFFKIDIDQSQIKDLKSRLANIRWPDEVADSGWDYGTNLSYLKELCDYWKNDFSWANQELFLNQFDHFKTEGEDINLHFIYQKGKGSKNLPLLLIHGWPDSFYRFIKLIPLLIEPDENGVAFDVIIPSIPGFGFSDKPKESGIGTQKIAALFNKLMIETLGYDSFYVHGGDWGPAIATQMAIQENEKIKGLHLTNMPLDLFFSANPAEFGEEEKAYVQTFGQWQRKEGAFAAIQGSKPQTVAYGLNDSPSGLAAWIIEKFNSWGDNCGYIENSFSKDELLTIISIYWFTQTAGSAARLYYETARQPPDKAVKINTPTHFSIFPEDCIQIPQSFGQRIYNIKRWNKMAKGGHFPALEAPDLLAGDIRNAFARSA